LSICKRDNKSAKLFRTPGTIFAENVKLYLHAHQVNCLISFIITKHLDRPFLTIPTVASLSHQSKMFLHFLSLPHKIAEITIGYNSKNAIDNVVSLTKHLEASQVK
jgi:hypothetical protein